MADLFNVVDLNPSDADKILQHLNKIRAAQASNSDLTQAISAANAEFGEFFKGYGKPYFTAHKLLPNDVARSEIYNENLSTLEADIARLYKYLAYVSNGTLTAYNYSSILAKEITNTASASASKVLDLSILNGFAKSQAIVAGDDFIDNSKIDQAAGISTSQAEVIEGANAIGLKKVDAIIITGPDTKVSIVPVKPATDGSSVNTQPTPQNLERFYEGKFYAHMGGQEPEGDKLEIKYIVDPSQIPDTLTSANTPAATPPKASVASAVKRKVNANTWSDLLWKMNSQSASTPDALPKTTAEDSWEKKKEAFDKAMKSSQFFAIVPASEADKNAVRLRMFDGSPETYWQCEYVINSPSLIGEPEGEDAGAGDQITG